jgi:hypothetical protein
VRLGLRRRPGTSRAVGLVGRWNFDTGEANFAAVIERKGSPVRDGRNDAEDRRFRPTIRRDERCITFGPSEPGHRSGQGEKDAGGPPAGAGAVGMRSRGHVCNRSEGIGRDWGEKAAPAKFSHTCGGLCYGSSPMPLAPFACWETRRAQ